MNGQASQDGRTFNITESIVPTESGTGDRRRYNPPLSVPISPEGFVDTTAIYTAVDPNSTVAPRSAAPRTRPPEGVDMPRLNPGLCGTLPCQDTQLCDVRVQPTPGAGGPGTERQV